MSKSTFQVDAAFGRIEDALGQLIDASGQPDSSGLRRYLLEKLQADDYLRFRRALLEHCSPEQFAALRSELSDVLRLKLAEE